MRNTRSDTRTAGKFWSQVDIKSDNECWLWAGTVGTGGYGLARIPGNDTLTTAHRAAWTVSFGDIPSDLEVSHRCIQSRLCVNPSHLYLATHGENMREVNLRTKNYLYPFGANNDTMKAALEHAKSEKIRYSFRDFNFQTVSDSNIIKIMNLLTPGISPVFSVNQKDDFLTCGHPGLYKVANQQGTEFCVMCEFQKADNFRRAIRDAYEKVA